MNDAQTTVGRVLTGLHQRDAIHFAVAPVVAAMDLQPGAHVGLNSAGEADAKYHDSLIGIVDPFLKRHVKRGEQFWLFLYPNTITTLRHVWEHPAFPDEIVGVQASARAESERWMRAWATEHMLGDWEGRGNEQAAYEAAIRAGRELHVGSHESARDFIDEEWWRHWENITGERGQRGEYFSCSC